VTVTDVNGCAGGTLDGDGDALGDGVSLAGAAVSVLSSPPPEPAEEQPAASIPAAMTNADFRIQGRMGVGRGVESSGSRCIARFCMEAD